MALDYSALFTDLGKLAKHYDLFKTDAADLDTDSQEILDAFQTDDQDVAIEGLASAYEGFKREFASRRAVLVKFAAKRLQDRATVLDEIGATSSDLTALLPKLVDQMLADSESINPSAVTIGSVSAASGNVGNGTVITSKTLDGVTSPGTISGVSIAANNRYKGLDSELTVPSDSLRVTCIADSYQDLATEGSEGFVWEGLTAIAQHGVNTEGSGQIGTVVGLHSNTLLSNLDFETFTSNVPGSWTIDAGTAGTHVLAEGTTIYHGASSLKLAGDGTLASIQLSQTPNRSLLTANRGYFVTCRVKADATIAAGDLTIQFEGTGYTAASTEKISIAHGSLPTSWTLYSFFIALPSTIPSDFELVIKWNGTPTNAKNLYLDDIAFGPATYGAGIAVAVVRGSTPFNRNDRFTFTVANTEGVFQRFFRRVFGVQLPSNASETIADSLAS